MSFFPTFLGTEGNVAVADQKLTKLTQKVDALELAVNQTLPQVLQKIAALELAPALSPKKTLRQRAKANWKFLAGLIVTLAGVLIAYFAWWQPQWKEEAEKVSISKVDKEIDNKLADHQLAQMENDVAGIKSKLDTMQQFVVMLVQSQMQKASAEPLPTFERNLHLLNVTLGAAQATRTVLPSHVVQQIQSKLVKSGRAEPDFWEAAAALINYQSPEPTRALPDCLSMLPKRKTAAPMTTLRPTDVTLSPVLVYQGCRLDLGEQLVVQEQYRNAYANSTALECDRCEVIYRGGEIPLFSKIRRILLMGCLFKVAASSSSPDQGKNLIADLLSAPERSAVDYTPYGE